ncbi:MAG: 50S ribosomal protein L30 [Candidatus Diapherotrites archaeon]
MIAVIRVRGSVNLKPDIKYTLDLLNLFRPNNMVLVKKEKQFLKMVEKVKDYVTFGEIKSEVLAKVLEKRGKIGKEKIDEEQLKKMKVTNFEELAELIVSGKSGLEQLGINKVFRLRPPKKGYERKGIKKPYSIGGALGNRKEKINDLILRMI